MSKYQHQNVHHGMLGINDGFLRGLNLSQIRADGANEFFVNFFFCVLLSSESEVVSKEVVNGVKTFSIELPPFHLVE